MSMNKPQLIDCIAKKGNISKVEAKKALELTIEAISEALEKGEDVALIGFGTFKVTELAERTGYTKTDNRYYWAEAGVFLSVDPLAEARAWISPYNYSQNNPITRSDPSGLLDGEFRNWSGKYLGNDGKNDNNIFIVGDKSSIKTIKSNEKRGVTTQASDVKVDVSTNKVILKEAVNVYNRTVLNGGFSEECSVISPDGSTVLRGQTGGDVRYSEASATLPYMKGNDNTSIHSHPLGTYSRFGKDGIYSVPVASRGGIGYDDGAFKNFKLNLIVGDGHPYDDGYRQPIINFYNRNTQLIGTMKMDNLIRIYK